MTAYGPSPTILSLSSSDSYAESSWLCGPDARRRAPRRVRAWGL